jgi:type I restriction enzyme, S subunit
MEMKNKLKSNNDIHVETRLIEPLQNKNIPTLRFPEFNDEWEKKKLGEVAEIGRGKSKHRPRDADFLFGGKYPFIQTGDVRKAELYLTEYSQTYSEAGLKQSKLWNEDTLCITIAANIAETAILKIKACFPDSVIGLIPKENATLVLFVKHLFDKFKIQIQSLSQGAAQDNLNQEKLSNIEFVFPTLPEQTKIAEFFTAIDAKIQSLKKKKQLLQQYKKGVMQILFSQGKDAINRVFTDDNGKPFPKWEMKKLGKLDLYISDGNYGELYPKASEMKNSGIPFIRANNIKNLSLVWNDMKFIEEDHHKILTSGHLLENDILVTTRGDIGMVAYVTSEFEGANINAQICLLRTKSNVNPKYLLQYLGSEYGHKQFKSLQTGSALKQLPKGNLVKLNIPYPTLPEQTKIANFLSSIDEKINRTESQIQQTQAWKKGLLQQMFV